MKRETPKSRRRGLGEGSIYQRSDGRWAASISIAQALGKRRRVHSYHATQADAIEGLGKLRERAERGEFGESAAADARRQSLGQFLDAWLEDSVKPSVRVLTHEQYRQHVKLYLKPLLGSYKLDKLAPQHIRAFIRKKLDDGLSPRTVQLSLVILRRALDQAVEDGLVARNTARLVRAPRVERFDSKTLSLEQARSFLEAAQGERLEPLYSVALTLGLRMGEALGLRWRNIDFDRRALQVDRILERVGRPLDGKRGKRGACDAPGSKLVLGEPKTPRSRRMLNLPDVCVRALKEHRTRQLEERLAAGPRWENRDLVFPSGIGTPLELHTLHDDFKRLLIKAKLPDIRFHDLRHSAASLMLAQGIPLRSIQEILGHSSITLTANLYAHVGERLKREAADAMDALLDPKVR